MTDFLIHWAIMSLSLWVASYVFNGIKFSNQSSLLISALMLGFVNAVIRPVLLILTLPLTLVTLGPVLSLIHIFIAVERLEQALNQARNA